MAPLLIDDASREYFTHRRDSPPLVFFPLFSLDPPIRHVPEAVFDGHDLFPERDMRYSISRATGEVFVFFGKIQGSSPRLGLASP